MREIRIYRCGVCLLSQTHHDGWMKEFDQRTRTSQWLCQRCSAGKKLAKLREGWR